MSLKEIAKSSIYKILGKKFYRKMYVSSKINDIKYSRNIEPEMALLKHFIKVDDTALDIGSNFGHYSINMAMLASNGTIFAFEPIPNTYQLNLEITNYFKLSNIKLYQLGVSDEKCKKKFRVPLLKHGSPNIGLAHLSERNDRDKTEKETAYEEFEVEIVTIDDFLNGKLDKLSFVKIDTEGAEYFVLKGMQETIMKCRPIMQIESSLEFISGFNVSIEEFTNLITEKLNYHMYVFQTANQKLRKYDTLANKNFILLPKEKISQYSSLIEA